jgi:hypothetical protein
MILRILKSKRHSQRITPIYVLYSDEHRKLAKCISDIIRNISKHCPQEIDFTKTDKALLSTVNNSLKTPSTIILLFSHYLNWSNYYKLGIAHSQNTETILIRVRKSNTSTHSLEVSNEQKAFNIALSCIRFNFLLDCDLDTKESFLGFIENFKRLFGVVYSKDITKVLYYKAVHICRQKGQSINEEIHICSQEEFTLALSRSNKQELKRYADLYIQGSSELERILIEYILSNKERYRHKLEYKEMMLETPKNANSADNSTCSKDQKVFISYGWRDKENDALVGEIERFCNNLDIPIVYDKKELEL